MHGADVHLVAKLTKVFFFLPYKGYGLSCHIFLFYLNNIILLKTKIFVNIKLKHKKIIIIIRKIQNYI